MTNRIIIFICFFACLVFPQQGNLNIELYPSYPRWLSAGRTLTIAETFDGSQTIIRDKQTDQTSGIAFIGIDENNNKNFLLADDIGALHRLIIFNDTIFWLNRIKLSSQVEKFLAPFPKKDFEEILYDRHTGRVIISIEGNKPEVKSTAGLYEITFFNNDLYSDSVTSIKKLHIKPEAEFLKYVDNNIGFEGLAADSKYYYAALEGFSSGILFADSTLIFIIDKSDLTIKKVLSTRGMGIATICGLYSDKDFSIYGIDRNSKKLFHILLDQTLDMKNLNLTDVPSSIPNYNSFDYVSAFESLTIDDEGFVYIVDDPWKRFYIPSENILSQLDEDTVRKFKAFVPVIYKFKLY